MFGNLTLFNLHYIAMSDKVLQLYIIVSVVPKGRSFTANPGTKAAVLPKGMFSTSDSGTKVAVLLRIE